MTGPDSARDAPPAAGFRLPGPLPPHRPQTELSRRARYVWAGRVGALLVRLWGRTLRIAWDLPEPVRALERSGENVVYAFWHAHILPLTYAYRRRGIVVMVSQHADGEYISQVMHRLGFGTVRGSSSRGGLRALMVMAALGRKGYPLGVSPDGPRGPRHVLQLGVLHISQRAGLPIVPVASAMQRGKRLASWDGFELPFPFSRILVTVGPPIQIPPEPGAEELVQRWGPRVQSALDAVEERAANWASAGPNRKGREP